MENTPLYRELQAKLDNAYTLRVNDLAMSIQLAEQARDIAERENWQGLYARALNQLGLFLMIKGEYARAISLSNAALNYFEAMNDTRGIANAKYNIASVYYKSDNFHEGLRYLLECLDLYRTLNDYHNEARVLKSMGTIYEYFGDVPNAIGAYERSITASRFAKDLNLESNAYNPLSGIYLNQGKVELAMSLIEKSIELKRKTNDVRGLAFALYGRGKILSKQGFFEEALSDYLAALEIHQTVGERLGEAMTTHKLGLLYKEKKEYSEAKKYLQMALEVSKAYNISIICIKAYHNLYHIAKLEGRQEEALLYLEEYISSKEAVMNFHTYHVIKSYESLAKIESLELEAKIQREKALIIENKNIELDSFFYRVSHDLKGPISSLMGLNNLVKKDVSDPTAQQYFDMYQAQIVRINTIVMELINLTRMGHGKENKQLIQFEVLINECLQSYSYLPHFTEIQVEVEVSEGLHYYAEWAIVNTILQNLIENAIKYCDPGKEEMIVRVVVKEQKGFLEIIVEDNGHGIPTEHQEKIFEMFFRASEQSNGTGLGLYILKRAVERLGGLVRLMSTPAKGSIFTVTLPFTNINQSQEAAN
ncbi:tetratricopeptide repeat-containing sensor histidine kinase [Cytophagales bacterium LB-30]|uniref:histidine kinase n=1 Tax=Shiella aurantiaca TaxID=3058365 RepID=A0ABT8F6N8_9BACT|nr:tetratricopeptide repeat-containing sensor histidine kinase [Shiella aurantiaca]MDN4166097.1 tetratricopeptide repeat-containing sensor histidine kinase [Shiella aurantiaca]